jgi:osmotically-inducible protein OsmY
MRFMMVLSLSLSLSGCAMMALTGAATGASMATDRRTAGTMLDDQTLEVKALHALSKHPELFKRSHITVASYNNVLLLLGQTPTEEMKQEVELTLKSLPRVQHVYNELTIGEPISLAARSKDAWITTKVKAKLLGNKHIQANRIKVFTENRIVYLLGITTTNEEILATELAQNTADVEKVVQIFEQMPEN